MKNNEGEMIYVSNLVSVARSLRSEHGENSEYDRALVELVYWSSTLTRETAEKEGLHHVE